jgi:hypothetical protein
MNAGVGYLMISPNDSTVRVRGGPGWRGAGVWMNMQVGTKHVSPGVV